MILVEEIKDKTPSGVQEDRIFSSGVALGSWRCNNDFVYTLFSPNRVMDIFCQDIADAGFCLKIEEEVLA